MTKIRVPFWAAYGSGIPVGARPGNRTSNRCLTRNERPSRKNTGKSPIGANAAGDRSYQYMCSYGTRKRCLDLHSGLRSGGIAQNGTDAGPFENFFAYGCDPPRLFGSPLPSMSPIPRPRASIIRKSCLPKDQSVDPEPVSGYNRENNSRIRTRQSEAE